MFLHDIKKESKIHCGTTDGSKVVTFHHTDGMYSYCTTEKGGVVHLSVMTPLKEEGDHYVIETKEAETK